MLTTRRIWPALGILILLPIAAVGASLAHTEALRASFDRQVWNDARYPGAALLGRWEGFGRLVDASGRHCDFAAQAVYGTTDDYEAVEAHYAARVLILDGPPVAYSVQPVSDRALEGGPPRSNDPDAGTRDLLIHTQTDLARARTFPTVFTVEIVSWGHAPWLDWRCE